MGGLDKERHFTAGTSLTGLKNSCIVINCNRLGPLSAETVKIKIFNVFQPRGGGGSPGKN
jgi:hypothetical protein